jgi:hypothetical protein
MGQEASVPLDHDFDEQARAPPSTANPSSTSNRTSAGSLPNFHRAFNAAASAAAASRPLSSKGMFQNSAQNEGDTRESAQAVATAQNQNEHFYDPSFDHPQLVEESVLLSQGTRFSPDMGHESSSHESHHPKSPLRGTPEGEGDAVSSHPVAVGNLPEKTGSKRGLFSTPGRSLAHSRGAALIHSMRNISLGKALGGGKGGAQSSKQQLDWEKQWDDDDDSEDEESEDATTSFSASSALDVTRTSSIGPPDEFRLTSATVPGQQSLAAQQLAPPSTSVREPTFPLEPEELLSDSQCGSIAGDGKPNVEMFLPMLRVLGKGSFGKVRSDLSSATRSADSYRGAFSGCFSPKASWERERSAFCNEDIEEDSPGQTPSNRKNAH